MIPHRRRRPARVAFTVLLCAYGALLALASLELVPLPSALDPVSSASGKAARTLRRAGVVPGLPLFLDRSRSATSIMANCVQVAGATARGEQFLLYQTRTCAPASSVPVLRGPYDKALIRLLMDAEVFRRVPPEGWPMSGDRILAAIGTHFCDPARGGAGQAVRWVRIDWRQTVEDRRDDRRAVFARAGAIWSCADRALVDRRWAVAGGGAR
jgi:hypothetical protein